MTNAFRLALLIFSLATALVTAAGAPESSHSARKVAVLVFNHVENIDFTGPLEVFDGAGFETFTVAADRTAVVISGGLKILPQYTFADAPDADVLVIPGGELDDVMMDEATLAWIKAKAAHAQYVMSVCNGAFILAHAGLLHGQVATTTSGNITALRRHSPDINVVRDKRVVDNGKIVTTGGLSAGIDGALHVVAKLRGAGHAQFVAQTLEYDWRPQGNYRPATYALRLLPMYLDQKLSTFTHVDRVSSTSGDARQWNISFLLDAESPSAELLAQIAPMLAASGKWGIAAVSEGGTNYAWKFKDDEGKPWHARARLDEVKADPKQKLLSIEVKHGLNSRAER